MRFEKRYEGVTYAIILRPRHSSKPEPEELKTLREIEIEVYRKHASGDRRGYVWKLSFDGDELKIKRYEDRRHDRRLLEVVVVKADWLEKWYFKDIERIIRDLGVKYTIEHIFSYLKIVFGHPLAIPLRL
jgi:hypothetical protein